MINEFICGVNRGKQGVNPLDNPTSTATGGTKTFADNLLPLKDSSGKPIALPRINQGSNTLNLLPQVNFGLPSGVSAQSAGQGINGAPTFGHDPRWPFVGTDTVQSITDTITWVKGSHNVKGGLYVEQMARNVSVYSVYNTAGTYYFGSDRANAVDAGYPYANALLGSIFAYGDDNKKQVNHARYTQIEWFAQDTWKVGRRLTLDYGSRFHHVGDLYSKGATLGLFRQEEYDPKKAGQLLYPACSIQTTSTCPAPTRSPSTRSRAPPSHSSARALSIPLRIRPAAHRSQASTSTTATSSTRRRSSSGRAPVLRGTFSATARPLCAADSASPWAAIGPWTISGPPERVTVRWPRRPISRRPSSSTRISPAWRAHNHTSRRRVFWAVRRIRRCRPLTIGAWHSARTQSRNGS